jgi:hypothetical protein
VEAPPADLLHAAHPAQRLGQAPRRRQAHRTAAGSSRAPLLAPLRHPLGTPLAPPWGTLWHPLAPFGLPLAPWGTLWAPFGHPLGTLWQGPSSAPAGASSGRAWWLWAARYPQVEAGPLGAPPHCRGCASEPPPKPPPKPPPTPPPKPPISPPISPPLPRQVLAIFDEAHHAASEGDPCAALLTTYYLLLTTDY